MNLPKVWAKKLKDSGFQDLESSSRISRRGEAPKALQIGDDVSAEATEAEMERRTTLLHLGISFPAGYMPAIELWAQGFGRAVIEQRLGITQKRFYKIVRWAEARLAARDAIGTGPDPRKNAKALVAAMDVTVVTDLATRIAPLIEPKQRKKETMTVSNIEDEIATDIHCAQGLLQRNIRLLNDNQLSKNRLLEESEVRSLKTAVETLIAIRAFRKKATKEAVEDLADEDLADLMQDPAVREILRLPTTVESESGLQPAKRRGAKRND